MDEAAQVINAGPQFTIQYRGDAKPGIPVSLDVLIERNKDDAAICQWARSTAVGGLLMTSGVAQTSCSIRRIL